MTGVRKSLAKVEVALRWDPSASGTPAHDLDIVAAVFGADDPHGAPVYVVYFGNRAPDGTITLHRDSRTGQGFGYDELMTLELDRMSDRLTRVVVGVVIQGGAKTFGQISGTGIRIREGATDLVQDDLAAVADATEATLAVFTRDASGGWSLDPALRGFTSGPEEFTRVMGAA
ncbi:TerD family protein [Streptomyces sp. 12297]|uniref:TerD family protein n=1 Tax=Streptomyces sp. NBC_00239 TaxID=2903640 RepID=UPI002E29F831|nr:TerD family protein [Streptomyces sp. NBC_00239]